MSNAKDLPINGIIESTTDPIENVEPGMFFQFDGHLLRIFPHESLDEAHLANIFFNEMLRDATADSTITNSTIISGSIRPYGERICFHVTNHPRINHLGICLGVSAYWITESDYDLENISMIKFSGLSIDSFCPMTNIQTIISENSSEIIARTSQDTIIDLGSVTIEGKTISITAVAYWTYAPCRSINFESRLICEFESLNQELIKPICAGFASALKFCLGRENVDFLLELYTQEETHFEKVGELVALHNKFFIPDELDSPDARFIRAKDIGTYFGKIITAYLSEQFNGPELSQNREDTNVISYSKVIELTSSFEREFRILFPDGIDHSSKTQRDSDIARNALCEAAAKLPAGPKRILTRLSKIIVEDNLESRIRYACNSLTNEVANAVFNGTGTNNKDSQLGKKISDFRNAIAHGNEPEHKLESIRNEYKLLIRLVFAMRLIRLQIPAGDVARLVKCKG